MWTFDKKSVTWVNDASDRNLQCPVCRQPICTQHLTKTDYDNSGEDILGWNYQHPCGAKLLIIND